MLPLVRRKIAPSTEKLKLAVVFLKKMVPVYQMLTDSYVPLNR